MNNKDQNSNTNEQKNTNDKNTKNNNNSNNKENIQDPQSEQQEHKKVNKQNKKAPQQISKVKYEITESQIEDMKCYKPMCIKEIDNIIEKYEGPNNQNPDVLKIKKNLKRYFQEILNNFKNLTAITGNNRLSENQLIKSENVIYTEIDENLKDQVQQKQQELLSVVEKYEQKKLKEEEDCKNKVLKFVDQNFPPVQHQQQQDISQFQLKCKNINRSNNKSIQSNNEDGSNTQNNNSQTENNSNQKQTESVQNMQSFVQDFIQNLQNKYDPQIRELQILDSKIEENNQKILKKMKSNITTLDQVKALQKLDLLN